MILHDVTYDMIKNLICDKIILNVKIWMFKKKVKKNI